VPPFGGPEGERVVIDARVAKLDSVIVEAGSHSDSVRLAPADLVRITGATVADVVAD
jgi:prolyl-tRNA editing enzyme YbaK/EbsC (Cys-tRNA(Pro) deacylase)